MGLTLNPPRELGRFTYTSTGTSASTSASGAAMSTTWGGSFTVGSRTSIDVEIAIPFLFNNTGGAAIYAEAHIMIDGVDQAQAFQPVANANFGSRQFVKFNMTMSQTTHTIAVFIKVPSGTGAIAASATNPGVIIVKEAPP